MRRRWTMILKKKWRLAVAFAFSLVIFIPVAEAEETLTFHMMGCSSGMFTTLSESKALTVYNIVGKGIPWGITGDRTFDNMTWQFAAVLRTMDGNTIGMGYYKFTAPDGDYFILEGTGGTVLEGGTWKFLHGTGKWKGITGQATGKFIMRGKPVTLKSERYWCRVIGTIQLPKQ
jgi:hypothetical protein